MSVPNVKPLVWVENPDEPDHSVISNIFGLTFEAAVDPDGQAYWRYWRRVDGRHEEVSGGLDDAKAAAQAEWERIILGALDVDTSGT